MNNTISKKYILTLDAKERITFIDVNLICKQNDSILFYITVMEDDKLKDLEGCKFSLLSNKSDGSKIEQIIDEPIIENGALILKPKKEFTSTKCSILSELTIFDEDEAITIQAFNFSVTNTIQNSLPEDIKDSVDTLIELNKIVQKYKNDIESIKNSLSDINKTLSGETHLHYNKETLDLITDILVNYWSEASGKVGTGEVYNNFTIVNAINNLYDIVNKTLFYNREN